MRHNEAEKARARERAYDVHNAGKRMLENPDHDLITQVFGGNWERYEQCVVANFGDYRMYEQQN